MGRETGMNQGERTAAFLVWAAGVIQVTEMMQEQQGGEDGCGVECAPAEEPVGTGQGAGCWPAECEFFIDTGVLVPAKGELMGCQGEGGTPQERALRPSWMEGSAGGGCGKECPLWLGAQGGSEQEGLQAELGPGQWGHPTGEGEDRDSGLTSERTPGSQIWRGEDSRVGVVRGTG